MLIDSSCLGVAQTRGVVEIEIVQTQRRRQEAFVRSQKRNATKRGSTAVDPLSRIICLPFQSQSHPKTGRQ
jgi:hypothetical protein